MWLYLWDWGVPPDGPDKVDARLRPLPVFGETIRRAINIAHVAVNKRFKRHLWMVTGRSSGFVSCVKRIKINPIDYLIILK